MASVQAEIPETTEIPTIGGSNLSSIKISFRIAGRKEINTPPHILPLQNMGRGVSFFKDVQIPFCTTINRLLFQGDYSAKLGSCNLSGKQLPPWHRHSLFDILPDSQRCPSAGCRIRNEGGRWDHHQNL